MLRRRTIADASGGGSSTDLNTIALYHFDGNTTDSGNNSHNATSSGTYITGKYGKGLGNSRIDFPNSIMSSALLGDFTIEFWYYNNTGDTGSTRSEILLGWSGQDALYSAVRIQVWRAYLYFYLEYYTGNAHGNHYTAITNSDIGDSTWAHIAFVKKGTTFYVFKNGVLMFTQTDTTCSQLGSDRTANCIYQCQNQYFDELRISNIARWTASFTPPTKAY